jgi:acetyltransferase-like isoleucine patch superfamily enzyme
MSILTKLKEKIFPLSIRQTLVTPFNNYYANNHKLGRYGKCGKHVQLSPPIYISLPQHVYLEDYTRIQPYTQIIVSEGKFVLKKFSCIGAGTIIVPDNHTPTVGIPQYLSTTHINDAGRTIVVNEDVWVGAGSFLLSHSSIGRGAVVAAGSVVSKEVPPYAVVAGSPAKIIACRFSVEQILQHEAILYSPEERMTRQQVEELHATHFEGKRVIGTSEISDEDMEKLNAAKQEIDIPVYTKD